MQLEIQEGARWIIRGLEQAGFCGYVVGGAVRDLVMNKAPHDFDIATDAAPEQIKRIFAKTYDTGIQHGTVTVIEDKIAYEVTTFREESGYTDGRHPGSVRFIRDLAADLARRDFTVNAMAYNDTTGLIDNFTGLADIQKKIIRCVGEPETRFMEDALRMLRAVRFAAVLGFQIAPDTAKAIKKCAVLIKKVSAERIREEFNKILLSDRPSDFRILHKLGLLQYMIPELDTCFFVDQHNKYHIYNVGEHIMHAVQATPPDLILRWAALLHDVGKPRCMSRDQNGIIHFYGHHRESMEIGTDILHRLRFDRDSMRDILVLVENHDVRIEPSPPAVKRMMARTGGNLFEKLLLLQEADNKAKNPNFLRDKLARLAEVRRIYREVLAEGQPYLVSDLVINGRDLIKLGFKAGREIGDTLRLLLDEVLVNPAMNNREYLLGRAKELRRKRRT